MRTDKSYNKDFLKLNSKAMLIIYTKYIYTYAYQYHKCMNSMNILFTMNLFLFFHSELFYVAIFISDLR